MIAGENKQGDHSCIHWSAVHSANRNVSGGQGGTMYSELYKFFISVTRNIFCLLHLPLSVVCSLFFPVWDNLKVVFVNLKSVKILSHFLSYLLPLSL